MRLVVDASVAVRWVLHQPGREGAMQLLTDFRRGAVTLYAPTLQRAEVGNVLWKYVRSKVLETETAERSFRLYLRHAPVFRDSAALGALALSLALKHARSVYDAHYLALSLELNCDFVTADQKLFRSVGPVMPNIQLLWPRPAL